MSELQTRFIDDTYVEYYNTGKHELSQIYLKSEADKVIAEKDKEIEELRMKRCDRCQQEIYQRDKEIAELKEQVHDYALGSYVMQARAEKEARHHKYKRCLAMASVEWLKQMTLYKYPYSILFRKAVNRERKWKELAEKFKEAK